MVPLRRYEQGWSVTFTGIASSTWTPPKRSQFRPSAKARNNSSETSGSPQDIL